MSDCNARSGVTPVLADRNRMRITRRRISAIKQLKNSVKEYAERVNAAMVTNPYHFGNDAMFENWKVVARLSQTIAEIEEALKKVYQVASELIADDLPLMVQVPALAAPTRSRKQSVYSQNDMMPTDVLVKTRKKPSKPSTRASIANQSPTKLAGTSRNRMELSGNAAKLLRHFERVLNLNEFTVISQTVIGQETGIPMGSMTEATRKLIESGRIIAGPTGTFRLVNFK